MAIVRRSMEIIVALWQDGSLGMRQKRGIDTGRARGSSGSATE
jgi:hypothetical protein